MTDERVARAGLTRLTEPGDPRVAGVVEEVGAVRLYDDVVALRGEREVDQDAQVRVVRLDPERELEQAAAQGIRFVIPGDAEWPTQLDALDHVEALQQMRGRPLGLWVKGPLRLDDLDGAVAVVGSRASTTYGEDVARDVGAGLARHGRCVVSGAAFGIDQAAHRGALALDGPSVAVLACGVDRAYPAAHRDLLARLGSVGAVVAEVPLGCAPMRMRFLARNRIIAGLSRGTVLVEAAVRSGALNTASWATRLSRSLMGVPGPVTSAQSQGVHHLVRSGAAVLVTTAGDVLEQVGAVGEHLQEEPRDPARPRDRLTRRHRQVLEAVPVHRAADVASIAETAGIGLLAARTALTHLAKGGFVEDTEEGWRLGPAAREVPQHDPSPA
jgi:DNA processing protein